ATRTTPCRVTASASPRSCVRSPEASATAPATTRSQQAPSPTTPDPSRPERQLLGEGRQAEIFAWDDGRVLRLYRDAAAAGPWLAREQLALRTARAAGLPVPLAYEGIELDGRPGLVMERVDGQDQLTALSAKPWNAFKIASTLG